MTLIEVVVAIAIMGVIAGAVYGFLIFANRETRAAGTKEEVVEKVNLFFLRVSQDIRNASEISTPPSPSPSPSPKLELNIPDKDNEDDIIIITYEWDSPSHCIRRKVEEEVEENLMLLAETIVLESENITNVEFNKVDDNKINIVVEAEIVVAGREQEQEQGQGKPFFSTMVTCRNCLEVE